MKIDICLSWFPVTVIKYPDKNKLEEKQFQVTVHHEGKSRLSDLKQLVTSMGKSGERMNACLLMLSLFSSPLHTPRSQWMASPTVGGSSHLRYAVKVCFPPDMSQSNLYKPSMRL